MNMSIDRLIHSKSSSWPKITEKYDFFRGRKKTDGRTDRKMDGQTLLCKREDASEMLASCLCTCDLRKGFTD